MSINIWIGKLAIIFDRSRGFRQQEPISTWFRWRCPLFIFIIQRPTVARSVMLPSITINNRSRSIHPHFSSDIDTLNHIHTLITFKHIKSINTFTFTHIHISSICFVWLYRVIKTYQNNNNSYWLFMNFFQ